MVDHHSLNTMASVARASHLRSGRPDWLQGWIDGETPDPILLEQVGFQTAQYYAVVIYQPHTDTLGGAQFAAMLQQEASRRGISGPVLPHAMSAVLFHPVEDPQQTARLKNKTEEIREQLVSRMHGAQVYCGVGRPARGVVNLRGSFHEAAQAVQLCSAMVTQSPRSTFFGNSSLYNLLLSLKNPAELQRFCKIWLSDLIDYDNQQHSELLITLNTYFANNGNTALTAKELKIHRNTLAYRLNRIAEITCLDLDDADVRLNLHLALKAHEVLGSTPAVGVH